MGQEQTPSKTRNSLISVTPAHMSCLGPALSAPRPASRSVCAYATSAIQCRLSFLLLVAMAYNLMSMSTFFWKFRISPCMHSYPMHLNESAAGTSVCCRFRLVSKQIEGVGVLQKWCRVLRTSRLRPRSGCRVAESFVQLANFRCSRKLLMSVC